MPGGRACLSLSVARGARLSAGQCLGNPEYELHAALWVHVRERGRCAEALASPLECKAYLIHNGVQVECAGVEEQAIQVLVVWMPPVRDHEMAVSIAVF